MKKSKFKKNRKRRNLHKKVIKVEEKKDLIIEEYEDLAIEEYEDLAIDEIKAPTHEEIKQKEKVVRMKSILNGVGKWAMTVHRILGLYAYKIQPQPHLQWREIITEINGNKYLGQWNMEMDMKEGAGIMVNKEGSIYEGYWKNDKCNGNGRLIYSEGEYYEGEFKDNKYHGKGLYSEIILKLI